MLSCTLTAAYQGVDDVWPFSRTSLDNRILYASDALPRTPGQHASDKYEILLLWGLRFDRYLEQIVCSKSSGMSLSSNFLSTLHRKQQD